MFSKKKLYIGSVMMLAASVFLGNRLFKNKGDNSKQGLTDATLTQTADESSIVTSADERSTASYGDYNEGGFKTNSVSTYEIVDDPLGSDNECLQVGISTAENPQTAFGVVRAVGDPETFETAVDLLFEDGQGGYYKVKTFEVGEVPGPEWRIIQPRTIACERGY